MASLSARGLRRRRWLLLSGPLVTLVAVAGIWQSARDAERRVRDRVNGELAQTAVAYLSVVPPAGNTGGYDPARLLAAVNSLAGASFWPGGLQVSLGAVPLLPDTFGLGPMPDSVLQALDRGAAPRVHQTARGRVSLVPFLDRDRFAMLGWAATWNTVRQGLPSVLATALTIVTVALVVVAAVVFLREVERRWRLVALLSAFGFVLVLAVDFGWSVHQTERTATETRLLTLKRLIEVAATAPGVRQAMLPEIAVGARVRPLSTGVTPTTDLVWQEDAAGASVSVGAATPRTQGGLELSIHAGNEEVDRLLLVLAGWVALAAAALGLAAWAAHGSPVSG